MKRILFIMSSLLLAGSCFLSSCEKEPAENGEGNGEGSGTAEPTVSITADQSFAEDNTAKLTLTLSAASSSDIKVTLAKATPQDGYSELTADYDKNITIKAGETSVKVDVEADVFGLQAGSYQAAIKIASATGAKVADNAVAYISYVYEYKPTVDLYADAQFAGDKTAKLQVKLAKAIDKDVVVTLADGEGSEAVMTYNKTVTVPAGQTEAEIEVTVEVPEGLEPGVYPGIITIASIENGVAGNASSVTINLAYPFGVNITIDGVFDDWNNPNVQTWTLPDGQVLYERIKKISFAANEKYVYMYAEFVDDFSWPISSNIFIDADDNPETGGYVAAAHNLTYGMPPYAQEEMGLEWYLEHYIHADATSLYNDMYSWNATYEYNSLEKLGVFGNLTVYGGGSFDGSTLYCVGTIDAENQYAKWEIQFNRTFFKMTGDAARFAFKLYEGDTLWGLLPQGTATDLNDYMSRELVPMAKVNLPTYVQ